MAPTKTMVYIVAPMHASKSAHTPSQPTRCLKSALAAARLHCGLLIAAPAEGGGGGVAAVAASSAASPSAWQSAPESARTFVRA